MILNIIKNSGIQLKKKKLQIQTNPKKGKDLSASTLQASSVFVIFFKSKSIVFVESSIFNGYFEK
jgi:hypothetical protein